MMIMNVICNKLSSGKKVHFKSLKDVVLTTASIFISKAIYCSSVTQFPSIKWLKQSTS